MSVSYFKKGSFGFTTRREPPFEGLRVFGRDKRSVFAWLPIDIED
jgi:hypothetical protein